MFQKLLTLIFVVISGFSCLAQDTIPMVKYNSEFRFRDGIYFTFQEWKDNSPRLTEFEAIKTNTYGTQDQIELQYSCQSEDGSTSKCVIKDCFAYVNEGKLYFSQGFYGYYYRVFWVGSLTHFIAYSGFDLDHDYYYGNMNSLMASENDFFEYILDFDSGEAYRFTYKIFSEFLKTKDEDLYNQLINSRRKKKMIHHFLLRYNEKHPVYFPAY